MKISTIIIISICIILLILIGLFIYRIWNPIKKNKPKIKLKKYKEPKVNIIDTYLKVKLSKGQFITLAIFLSIISLCLICITTFYIGVVISVLNSLKELNNML